MVVTSKLRKIYINYFKKFKVKNFNYRNLDISDISLGLYSISQLPSNRVGFIKSEKLPVINNLMKLLEKKSYNFDSINNYLIIFAIVKLQLLNYKNEYFLNILKRNYIDLYSNYSSISDLEDKKIINLLYFFYLFKNEKRF